MPSGARNRLVYNGWVFEPFTLAALDHTFDCGRDDLNDFFANDLIPHEDQLFTRTYVLTPQEATVAEGYAPVAFISFCNDAIQKGDFKTAEAQQAIDSLPEPKRYRALPAVKIARLGVQKELRGRGVGSFLLNVAKCLFLCNNRTGCRFLTVDAYNDDETLHFYQKSLFQFLTEKDKNRDQRALFFDLKRTPDNELEAFSRALQIKSAL